MRLKHQSISLALTAALLVCPLVCAGHCCQKEDAGVEQSRCHCCCEKESRDRCGDSSKPDSGDAPSKDPRAGASCICHGAVMDHATWFGVELDVRWDLPAVVPALAAEIAVPHSWIREATMPDDGVSPGRALCRLHSRMQC